jgi:hypothetical protein
VYRPILYSGDPDMITCICHVHAASCFTMNILGLSALSVILLPSCKMPVWCFAIAGGSHVAENLPIAMRC